VITSFVEGATLRVFLLRRKAQFKYDREQIRRLRLRRADCRQATRV